MSYSSELHSYIGQMRQRLQLGVWLRGTSLFAGTALVVTLVLVLVLNRLAFPAHGVAYGRLALILALASVAAFGLAIPLARLTRTWAVRRAEKANPDLEQRLSTFHDHESKGGDPFLELLAADTLARTQELHPSTMVPANHLFALAGAGLACLGVLVWMITAAPGYVGYGASLLWTGGKKDAAPLYAISVQPGNTTVRRNSDQLITARIKGMQPEQARLFARYASATGWEPVTMQPVPGSSAGAIYQFVFTGLPENVEYYVSAGPLVSPHFKVRVVDLPSIKDIHVTYHYPAWTGLKPASEEHSGDLRAIEGTEAQVELQMDRPMNDGQLTLDGGKTIQLTPDGSNTYRGTIPMQKDGAYHLSAIDEGQSVRLSEDYFIATDKAMPPELSIDRPGGDYRASPIEEVTVGVKASDEFGLRDMHLHYSVNGGSDHDVGLLKSPGVKTADGSHSLSLEDYKLKPGDLISIYATAKDGHSEARTDISFIQVDPFEREFSQSQQAGGGGGGSGGGNSNQTDISKREKELIAATWKQQNDKTATAKDNTAQGQFLSDAQQKLRDQVNALSARMQSRDISEANTEFTEFDKDMQDAAAAMAPSADRLRSAQWKDAIPLEQKALQALLRAEATFRQIQVAFGQAGGGSGGGNAGRDLASLFDLELDTEKNQYETAQTASPAEQHQKNVEDALQKLDALAKRQEDLANQQRNPQQAFEQRWQQEMLRREAEQLQRQLEQMAQNGQQNANGSPSSQSPAQQNTQNRNSSSGQSSSTSARPQSGNPSSGASGQSSDPRIAQALSRLQQAAGEMRRGDNAAGQNADSARKAAEALRDAQNLLAGSQQQLASGKLDSLAREANRLREEERAQAGEIGKLASPQPDAVDPSDLNTMLDRRRQRDQLAGKRQELSDSLSKLQQNLRGAARALASNQPGTAQKLRDALTEMDDSDLDNRVQRTADWLRRGIDPNSNGTESDIAQGLDKLSQQLQQAQRSMGQELAGSKPGPSKAQGDQTALLNQVERLRSQIEAMARSQSGSNQTGAGGNRSQSGAQQFTQGGQLSRNGQPGSNGLNPNDPTQRSDGRSGQFTSGQPAGAGSRFSGDLGNQTRAGASGDVRNGGGPVADGTVWNNINTGNNRYGRPPQQAIAGDPSANPADTERTYQQEMRELGRLRQLAQGDPETQKEIAELTRQMQRLDPSRFPGNPAMVEQMHREVLSSVDRLELELQRAGRAAQARTSKPYAIPNGYEDAVADYYKRLSKNQ